MKSILKEWKNYLLKEDMVDAIVSMIDKKEEDFGTTFYKYGSKQILQQIKKALKRGRITEKDAIELKDFMKQERGNLKKSDRLRRAMKRIG